jgi:hypothetical protein
MLTEALPDVQPLVEGSPFRVRADEKRHIVALCTTAWRCTSPPDTESAEGVAVKRAMLAFLSRSVSCARCPAVGTERVGEPEATREPRA